MFRKHTLSPEERSLLEERLRQDLQPVIPDPAFVRRTYGHLQDPRRIEVPLHRPLLPQHGLLVLASLSGALLTLALAGVWVYWHRRASP